MSPSATVSQSPLPCVPLRINIRNNQLTGPSLELPEDDIHLWLFETNFSNPVIDLSWLTPAESLRAAKLADAAAADRFRLRRGGLRLALARYLGCPPGDVPLVVAPGGKPALLPCKGGETMSLSTSHRGGYCALALARQASLGVDIETVPQEVETQRAMMRLANRREQARLAHRPGAEGGNLAACLWTGKEALAKRHGAGLRLDKEGDDLDLLSAQQTGKLIHLTIGSGFIAALAATRPIERLTVFSSDAVRHIELKI